MNTNISSNVMSVFQPFMTVVYGPILFITIVGVITFLLTPSRLNRIASLRSVRINILHLNKEHLLQLDSEVLSELRTQLLFRGAIGALLAFVMSKFAQGIVNLWLLSDLIAVSIQLLCCFAALYSLSPYTKRIKKQLESGDNSAT